MKDISQDADERASALFYIGTLLGFWFKSVRLLNCRTAFDGSTATCLIYQY